MTKQVRWAVMGCGNIAGAFARDLKYASNGKLVAAGSRTLEKAQAFIDEHGGRYAFGSYQELARCEDVDIIYVASPHPMHFENAMLCLENGKAVLCEKPFTLNAAQAKELVKTARDKKIFLMEAMWTRFIPAIVKVRQLLKDGAIGEVKNFTADFGVRFEFDPEHRAFCPTLGGGALLDLGVYPISLASMVFGTRPKKIVSVVNIGSTGVDYNESLSFLYESGAVASISAGLEAKTAIEAVVSGTEGSIKLDSMFFRTKRITLAQGEKTEVMDFDFDGHGYQFEAEHAGQCLIDGKTESDVMGLDESIEIMETLDEIRADWGLVYPQEK